MAAKLRAYEARPDVIVLALPRGGVPVAFEVASALHAPLDVFVVRPLGAGGMEEPFLGAIASGGVQVLDQERIRELGLVEGSISAPGALEWREVERRERAYRGPRSAPALRGRTLILVDDGLTRGPMMRAAVRALRQQGAASVVAAVPVGDPELSRALHGEADEFVCAVTPSKFYAVGLWYRDFKPVTTEDVRELLVQAARERETLPFAAARAGLPVRAWKTA